MSDDFSISSCSNRLRVRERAIRATRLRLQHVEIETHRIKADLARLESENETDIADELTSELRFDFTSPGQLIGPSPVAALRDSPTPREQSKPESGPPRSAAKNQFVPAAMPRWNGKPVASQPHIAKRRRSHSRAWLVSVALHLLVLAILAPMTYVIATHDTIPLFASMFAPESSPIDVEGTAPIELVNFEEPTVSDEAIDSPPNLLENVEAVLGDFSSPLADNPAPAAGRLNALPTDVGTLMAGGGDGNQRGLGLGRGAASEEARLGRTSFFGTPARANRVVFLVDNSASMKQGRMETTLVELARSVEQLGEKQEFYVVFYSDQAYPMMYPASVMEPLAATRENKQRLYAWLQTVELCIGGALLKAVELADSLEPEVVYLLSDGDITGTATMDRLAQISERTYPIHTLGMGVKKPVDAQNLARIAQANRGTFQLVGTLPAAVQMAKARPIRSNPFNISWGQGSLVGGR